MEAIKSVLLKIFGVKLPFPNKLQRFSTWFHISAWCALNVLVILHYLIYQNAGTFITGIFGSFVYWLFFRVISWMNTTKR